MTSPLVSVVMPAHNAAPWIGETLQSVLRQSHPAAALEIIVVDDGSTDGTAGLAARTLATSSIAHVVVEAGGRGGPSPARNLGWQRARGEWIQFLDADDLLEPDKIAVQSAALGQLRPDVAMVFSPWRRLVQARGGAWIPASVSIDPRLGDDPMQDLLGAENFIATGSQLFRRTWLERVSGFNEAHRLVEDVDLMLRLVHAGARFERVPSERPLFWYRQRPASLSRESRRAFVTGCVRNLKTAERWWQDSNALTDRRRAFLVEAYFNRARFFAEHDVVAFRALVDHILELSPAFVPSGPLLLRYLTRLVGYDRAEGLAVRYRQLRQRLGAR